MVIRQLKTNANYRDLSAVSKALCNLPLLMDINLMLACCQNDKLLLSVMPLISHELARLPFKIHNNATQVTFGVR